MSERRDFFVTGTDTGVGKTLAATAMLHAWRAGGRSVAGFKPIASGSARTAGGLRNDDALALQAASSREWDYGTINPYVFEPAIAPHLAAAEAGVSIRFESIREAFGRLREGSDVVVAEGAGGFLVPLAPGLSMADLATSLGCEIVLVVGLRLGCLNHAFLTTEAIRARGLALAGWIGSLVEPGFERLEGNLATLSAGLRTPCLGVIGHLASPDPAAAAACLTNLPAIGIRPAGPPDRAGTPAR